VWASTALWTEDGVVGPGCSAGVGVQQSACSVVAGEAETAVGVVLFGWGEEVQRG
jgi:hypothetical protein